MATFSGQIDALRTSKASYNIGEYPELLVDFTISGHDLAIWELEWHAYLVAMGAVALPYQEIGEVRSDFSKPGFLTWPNPDTHIVTQRRLRLTAPMPNGQALAVVSLYGSTTVRQPEGLLHALSVWLPLTPASSASGWQTVATAQVNSSGVQGSISKTLDEIPPGTQGRLKFEAFGLGPIFDAPGVEAVIQTAFNLAGQGLTVIDAWGEGFSTGWVSFHASPLAVVPLLWAVAAVLAALGITFILVTVSVLIWKAGGASPLLTLALVGGAVLGVVYLVRRQPAGARR